MENSKTLAKRKMRKLKRYYVYASQFIILILFIGLRKNFKSINIIIYTIILFISLFYIYKVIISFTEKPFFKKYLLRKRKIFEKRIEKRNSRKAP